MLDRQPALQAPPLEGPGVRLRPLCGLTIRHVAASAASGVPPNWPAPGQAVALADGHLMRLATDACLWLGAAPPDLAPAWFVTDQSDSWAVVEIAGRYARHLLARLVPLDLASWPVASAGRTVMHHLPVIVLKTADDGFILLSPRSTAADFWQALGSAVDGLPDDGIPAPAEAGRQ